jgi:ABC-type multidrug transport system permease subunit
MHLQNSGRCAVEVQTDHTHTSILLLFTVSLIGIQGPTIVLTSITIILHTPLFTAIILVIGVIHTHTAQLEPGNCRSSRRPGRGRSAGTVGIGH